MAFFMQQIRFCLSSDPTPIGHPDEQESCDVLSPLPALSPLCGGFQSLPTGLVLRIQARACHWREKASSASSGHGTFTIRFLHATWMRTSTISEPVSAGRQHLIIYIPR